MTATSTEHDKRSAGPPRLVLLRHAQSAWNLEKRFTGWADVPLTPAGREEARRAGEQLRTCGLRFDRAFVSRLQRAAETLEIVLRELDQPLPPVERSWRLNERHLGILEGLDKTAVAAQMSADELLRYRRGYRDRPPALAANDPRHPRHQALYHDVDPALLPATESLADTAARLLPYWAETVEPAIARGERVLFVSHNQTLRALIMHLEGRTEHELEHVAIPNARPLAAAFDTPGVPVRYAYLDDVAPATAHALTR